MSVFDNSPFECAELIRQAMPDFSPRVALILGSGLGGLASQLTNSTVFPYQTLPGFPISTVEGHAGELLAGWLNGVAVICMKGRGHFYEGKGASVMTNAVRLFQLLGCELMLATNAAGSLRAEVGPGELVVLTDHINLQPGSPMAGPNDDRFGPRFFSMANAYDAGLRSTLSEVAQAAAIPLHQGVFVAYSGPNFETPAEIRMMINMGADVVGMSIVPEVISARHCGLSVLAISAITNLAEGLSDVALSHEQTLSAAQLASGNLIRLVSDFVTHYGRQNA